MRSYIILYKSFIYNINIRSLLLYVRFHYTLFCFFRSTRVSMTQQTYRVNYTEYFARDDGVSIEQPARFVYETYINIYHIIRARCVVLVWIS